METAILDFDGKAGLFCIVGTSDQDTDRSFESSFAGRKAGCGSMPTGIILNRELRGDGIELSPL